MWMILDRYQNCGKRVMGAKMKKTRIHVVSLLIAAMMTLSGCGPTKLYELTEEERDVIVHYAAYALGKYNIYQKDGMTDAVASEEELEQPETPKAQEKPQESVETGEPAKESQAQEKPQEPLEMISLSRAIGQSNKVSVKYKGYKISDSYQEGGYYSIPAENGKCFVVMKFMIKNTSGKAVKVDALSMNPGYAAVFAEAGTVQAEQTFLTYSLSTYQGKLEARKSVDVVLLFQIPKSQSKKLGEPVLNVRLSGKEYQVQL